jgi:hypothetical protein
LPAARRQQGEKGRRDRASPCLEPRSHWIQGSGQPFTRTADLEVVRSFCVQLHQMDPKPLVSMIALRLSMILSQMPLQNQVWALEWGPFGSGFNTKFSEIDLPLMKPVWSMLTSW